MMLSISTSGVLEQNALFRGLCKTTVEAVARLAHRRRYGCGEVVFSQGDFGDALFGVAFGRVRLFALDADGREMFLDVVGPGGTFGEIAVIDGLPRTAGAVTVQPSTLVVLPRAPFLEQVKSDPELAVHLLRLLCGRLRGSIEQVEESVFLSTSARIAKRLMSLIVVEGRRVAPRLIEVDISQSELASFLGVSRQAVNGHLQEWRKAGVVEPGHGRIVVRDVAALHRIATDATARHD